MVSFTSKNLRKFFASQEALIARHRGRPIGMLVHCDQCSEDESLYAIASMELRDVVDSELQDAVESVLNNRLFFYARGLIHEWEEGVLEILVCSTKCFYESRGLFTGIVQMVNPITKRLVPGDLESFFGFESQSESDEEFEDAVNDMTEREIT